MDAMTPKKGQRVKAPGRPVLAALVHPLTEGRFFEEHWPTKPFVHHGSLDRLSFLPAVKDLGDLGWLVKRWRGAIRAWPKVGSGLPELEIFPQQALALYDAGYTLFFSRIERRIPSVRRLFNQLAGELGLPPSEAYCEAFFSREGSGTGPHFDGNWGFNIQLRGDKDWHIAPNLHVDFPESGTAMHQQPDRRLLRHARLPFPREMPTGQRFRTRAGSVVFVPNAAWHATRVVADSAALVFTVHPRRWSRLLAEEIEARLSARLTEARCAPLFGIPDLRERCRAELGRTLNELRSLLASLDGDDLLRSWSGERVASYAVAEGVEIEVVEREGSKWSLAAAQSGRRFDVELEPSTGPVLRWIAGRGMFSLRELYDAFPDRVPNELAERVGALERAHLVSRVCAEAS
jgi:ribosomal protein L16 Arg81 hydroxylase